MMTVADYNARKREALNREIASLYRQIKNSNSAVMKDVLYRNIDFLKERMPKDPSDNG